MSQPARGTSAGAPDLRPLFLEGGPVNVLLVHGFTGSPAAMRPWAQDLHEAGHTVSVPLLPGHATSWQQMNTTTWQDWFDAIRAAHTRLVQRGGPIIVCGLSMGGALALRLAEVAPGHVNGLVLVNAAVKVEDIRLRALPFIKNVIPSLPGISNDIKKPGQDEGAYDRVPLKALHSQLGGWAQVIRDLDAVNAPLLLLRSRVDHVVPASSSALILTGVGSEDVTEVILEDSYHVATLDHDYPTILARSKEFIERVCTRDTRDEA